MYFKRLEIFGFKSFADKTALNFEPGITAVVGPNGCGKSNIFDAIRWVLGEQSVKELRGSAMEDVIFNGTDKKTPLGFAEVSLTFSNESKVLPVEYDEVTVTRRLFRSGESEYLLNKTAVRLKDIVELFMGTGVGAEAYSLVQQGKVDLVVSARPEDRRVILDEASGITKYKAKKREALSKLKETDDNLLRINDIVIEVKRQIASLERQANKARRYKKEFEELKAYEIHLAKHQMAQLENQEEQIRAQGQEWQQQQERLAQELKEFSESLEIERNLWADLEDRIAQINADDIKLDGKIDVHLRQMEFNEERLENNESHRKRIATDQEHLAQRIKDEIRKVEELKGLLSDLDARLDKSRVVLEEKKGHFQAVVNLMEEAKRSIDGEENRILTISSSQVQIKNRLTDVMKENQGGLARKRRLELEQVKVQEEKAQVEVRLQEVCQRVEVLLREVSQFRETLDQQQQQLRRLEEEFSCVEKQIDDLEKQRLFLVSQKEFIEKLRVQYHDIPDPIVEGPFLTTTAPLEHHTGIIGKVKQVSVVSEEKVESLKDHLPNAVSPMYQVVCEAKFIELDPQQISLKIDRLTEQIEQLNILRAELESKIQEQKQSTTSVESHILEQEKHLSVCEAQKGDISADVLKLQAELELLQSEMTEVTVLLEDVKKKEFDLTSQLDRSIQELQQSQLSIKEKQDLISSKIHEREQISISIAQLETEIASVEEKRKSDQRNLEMFSRDLENARNTTHRLEQESEELDVKDQQYRDEMASLQQQVEQLKQDKEALQDVLRQQNTQKEEVASKLESLQIQVAAASGAMEELKNTIHHQQLEEQQSLFKKKEIRDRLWQTYKMEWEAVDQLLQAAAQASESVSAEPVAPSVEGADTVVAPVPMPVEASLLKIHLPVEELALAIDRLKKRCDAYGAVNLVAIEEFEELRQRFEFLTKQQSDLITAKESLHKTIQKINRETREMFMETFSRVSEEFRTHFRLLFGGGEAQLILLDPENVLESGIEIIARPPGKKLQSISLLSGGEKSLTAIALIFGVFKVNPSPFCVLDEIDAALDESNVGRFAYVLKEFAKIAQFIVITHNKKTIANANVMYGITMEETGVSKIVSVKFQDKQAASEESSAAVPA